MRIKMESSCYQIYYPPPTRKAAGRFLKTCVVLDILSKRKPYSREPG